jgi:membrane-associated protease RseP (regulator of RpoE activity)
VINLGSIPLAIAVHLAGMIVVARLVRIPLYGIHYGVGPTLLRKTLGRTQLSLRLLPFGGHIQLEPSEDVVVDWEAQPRPRWPVLPHLSRSHKALLYASGCSALVIFGMAILGASEALASLGRGFGQILGGAMDPLGKGSDNVRALGRLFSSAPFLACAAVVSIKAAAFNLLPIPPLNGAQILQSALLPDADRTWLDWAANLGALVLLLIIGSYSLAVGVVLWFS